MTTAYLPQPLSATDMDLRRLVDQVCLTKQPITPQMRRPKELGPVSLLMLAKDEWQTLEQVVDSLVPLPTELIIGVDTSSDTPLSLAYREAHISKGGEECAAFFEQFVPERRRATFEEIAAFLGVTVEKLTQRTNRYLEDGLPTRRAAERCIEKVGAGKIIDLDFNNHFGNSRNTLLEHATGDYCMFVDGHEFLSDSGVLMSQIVRAEKIYPEWVRMSVRIFMKDSRNKETNSQTRIWRNVPGVRFERGVHNMLMVPNQEETKEIEIPEAVLVHDRPDWLQRLRDPQRNSMVREYMEANLDDHSSVYYSALTAHRCSDYDAAMRLYGRYLELRPMGSESAMACFNMGLIQTYDKQDKQAGLSHYFDGARRCPDAAFCYVAAGDVYLLLAEELEQEKEQLDKQFEAERLRLLKGAARLFQIASGCELPSNTIALPMDHYSWMPYAKLAEAHRRMANYREAAKSLDEALAKGMPQEYHTGDIAALRVRCSRMADLDYRASAHDGKRHLYIVTPDGQAASHVFDAIEGSGIEVKATNEFSVELFYEADAIWIEGCNEAAMLASSMYRAERDLFINVHGKDALSPFPGLVRWAAVDAAYVPTEALAMELYLKFGIPPGIFKHMVPVPDLEGIAPVEESSKDVLIFCPIRFGSGIERLPDLAANLRHRTIWLGGAMENDSAYEWLVSELGRRDLKNVKFCGAIGTQRINSFLQRGGAVAVLSPLADMPREVFYAQAAGLPVVAFDAPWAESVQDRNAIAQSAESLAKKIKAAKPSASGPGYVRNCREVTKGVIRDALQLV